MFGGTLGAAAKSAANLTYRLLVGPPGDKLARRLFVFAPEIFQGKISFRTLPIALPRPADRRHERVTQRLAERAAVVETAMVFLPGRLIGVLI